MGMEGPTHQGMCHEEEPNPRAGWPSVACDACGVARRIYGVRWRLGGFRIRAKRTKAREEHEQEPGFAYASYRSVFMRVPSIVPE